MQEALLSGDAHKKVSLGGDAPKTHLTRPLVFKGACVMSRKVLTEISIPVPEEKNSHDGIVFEKETAKQDRDLVPVTFSHWPTWAVKALAEGLNDLLSMPVSQRKKLAVKARKDRTRRRLASDRKWSKILGGKWVSIERPKKVA
jgi:hypothetical protein